MVRVETNTRDVERDIDTFFRKLRPAMFRGIRRSVSNITSNIAAAMRADPSARRRSDGRYIDRNRASPPTLRVQSGRLKQSLLSLSRAQSTNGAFYQTFSSANYLGADFGSNVNDRGFFYGGFHDSEFSRFNFFFTVFRERRNEIVASVRDQINRIRV